MIDTWERKILKIDIEGNIISENTKFKFYSDKIAAQVQIYGEMHRIWPRDHKFDSLASSSFQLICRSTQVHVWYSEAQLIIHGLIHDQWLNYHIIVKKYKNKLFDVIKKKFYD